MWTWPDFFIVHFTGHNRDVDVGEQDINRPTWHLTKKNPTLNMFFVVVIFYADVVAVWLSSVCIKENYSQIRYSIGNNGNSLTFEPDNRRRIIEHEYLTVSDLHLNLHLFYLIKVFTSNRCKLFYEVK